MTSEQKSNRYLLTSEALDQVNSSSIAQLFKHSMSLIWPNNDEHDSVLVLLTSSSRHMKEAANSLKLHFPSLIHLTCMSQALNNITDILREEFREIDILVTRGRSIFIEQPSRINLLKDVVTGFQLPPKVRTGKGVNWIEAAIYYSNNFKTFRQIIDKLDYSSSSTSVCLVKKVLQKNTTEIDLNNIASHFADLPNQIKLLEQNEQPLSESLKLFDSTFRQIYSFPITNGRSFKQKCLSIFAYNGDLIKITKLSEILNERISEETTTLNPAMLSCFKYCPVSCVNIKDCFSGVKDLIDNNKNSINHDELKKMLVISCYKHTDCKKVAQKNEIYIKSEQLKEY